MASVADLIVVSGPPGAGKSTVARALSGLFDPSALVSGDQFFAFIDRGFVAPWTAAAHRQNEVVVGAAAATAGRLATGGYTVVYDGVIGPWFLDTFGAATGLDSLHYAILRPPGSSAWSGSDAGRIIVSRTWKPPVTCTGNSPGPRSPVGTWWTAPATLPHWLPASSSGCKPACSADPFRARGFDPDPCLQRKWPRPEDLRLRRSRARPVAP